MKTMLGISVLFGVLAMASHLDLVSADGCPFSSRARRMILQAPTPLLAPTPLPAAAPTPLPSTPPTPLPSGRPTGNDIFEEPLLNFDFYTQTCPTFEAIVKDKVTTAVAEDSLAPAFLLRLFFHDCFVQGCDGSLLLNSTVLNLAEKDQAKSVSLNKFYVIDAIKDAAEAACPGVVSCADILAATAVEAVVQVSTISCDIFAFRSHSDHVSMPINDQSSGGYVYRLEDRMST